MFNWDPENFNFNNNPAFALVTILLTIWEIFWKSIALWKSAKRSSKYWFIAILVLNTFGILPIVYLWRTKQLNETINDVSRFFKKK